MRAKGREGGVRHGGVPHLLRAEESFQHFRGDRGHGDRMVRGFLLFLFVFRGAFVGTGQRGVIGHRAFESFEVGGLLDGLRHDELVWIGGGERGQCVEVFLARDRGEGACGVCRDHGGAAGLGGVDQGLIPSDPFAGPADVGGLGRGDECF